MLQNEGFKLFFSEIYFCLRDLGPQNYVKHLGPLGKALPHPRLLRHCGLRGAATSPYPFQLTGQHYLPNVAHTTWCLPP